MDPTLDPFDSLDIEKLEHVLQLTKEAGVRYFKCGSVEFSFDAPEEEEASMGFVPTAERAITAAQKQADENEGRGRPDPFDRAFNGNKPQFRRATQE